MERHTGKPHCCSRSIFSNNWPYPAGHSRVDPFIQRDALWVARVSPSAELHDKSVTWSHRWHIYSFSLWQHVEYITCSSWTVESPIGRIRPTSNPLPLKLLHYGSHIRGRS